MRLIDRAQNELSAMNTRQIYEYAYRQYRANKGNAAISYSKGSAAAWRTYHANFEAICADPISIVNHMSYKAISAANMRISKSRIALMYKFASNYNYATMHSLPASEEETLDHMWAIYRTYGNTELHIWKTSTGKWIDELVLITLAEKGKIVRTIPAHPNIYAQCRYSLIVGE